MKKVIFIATAIAFLRVTSTDASAQQVQEQTQQAQAIEQNMQDENKVKVSQYELPEPVKTSLKCDVYKNWTVGDIYKVLPTEGDAEGKIVYEVNMTNAEGQPGIVRINEKGGIV
ncbi:hypothetical protein ACFSKU_18495 [Pontibacter silvestris]|uniref:PepSY domain-containing protein n=1 Tax=Pontibacter silvestris TaxID=2305183 RepID=A0ABW4X430_9BACT|nr:hypothetical protein [Pontibacter silvestris]MCC9135117.1 hypothetical protein [Pontibacter silvestris]